MTAAARLKTRLDLAARRWRGGWLSVLAVVACANATSASNITSACPESPEQVLAPLNALRAQGASCGSRGAFPPAEAVQWNDTLQLMVQQHAQWLVSVGELRHHNAQGQALSERALAAGYRFARIGENLAHGQRTLDAVLRAWAQSETHCGTLFGAAYTETALACERAADGRPLWVMVMARPLGPNRLRR
jgi:uncharacterized protein YkwD